MHVDFNLLLTLAAPSLPPMFFLRWVLSPEPRGATILTWSLPLTPLRRCVHSPLDPIVPGEPSVFALHEGPVPHSRHSFHVLPEVVLQSLAGGPQSSPVRRPLPLLSHPPELTSSLTLSPTPLNELLKTQRFCPSYPLIDRSQDTQKFLSTILVYEHARTSIESSSFPL